MQQDEFNEHWSSLHNSIEVTGAIKYWLLIARPIANLLSKVRANANLLSLLGLVAAVALWKSADHWYALGLLAISLLCDGLDGAVAIIRGTSGTRGAVLDSVADRIGEFFWALTFYEIGVNFWIVGSAYIAATVQEYVRARFASLESAPFDFVSICERPVRAIFLAAGLISVHFSSTWASRAGIFWCTFQVVALVTVLMEAFTRLRTVNVVDDQLSTESDEG